MMNHSLPDITQNWMLLDVSVSLKRTNKERYKRLQILIRLLILVLGFWCLTPLSTILKIYRGGPFSWRTKLEYQEKITDLS